MTANLTAEHRMMLEKIANMQLMGISQSIIADAVALSEGRVSQIVSSPEYVEILNAQTAAQIEQLQLLNQGWDGVEQQALTVVINNLRYNKDPEFALRAAMVANKAHRRGGLGSPAVLNAAQGAGARVVINLQQNFVAKLQQRAQIPAIPGTTSQAENAPEDTARKMTSVLDVNSVKRIFGMEAESHEDYAARVVEDAFAAP